MVKIKWSKHMNSSKVLKKIKIKNTLIGSIRKSQLKLIGQIFRNEGSEKMTLTRH